MENRADIIGIASLLCKAACSISDILADAEKYSTPTMQKVLDDLLLDEVHRAQILILALTSAISDRESFDEDGESAFFSGELEDEI